MTKFTYSIMVAGMVLLGLSSCNKDLLQQLSPDQLTTDNFYTTKERAVSGLAAAYSQLEDFVGWDNFVEARSVCEFYREDFVEPGADAYNYPWWLDHFSFSFTSGNTAINLIWGDNYRGLNLTNQVLENVAMMKPESIDDASRKMILAEATFLRAYYHFRLLQNFKNIIIRDKVPQTDADLAKATAARPEVYDHIIKDLKAAIPNLPLRSQRPDTELGRVTKGAAEAYLGKIYLYRAAEEPANATAHYEQAAIALKNVITSGEYQMEANFMGMFNGTLKNSVESIFELQQTAEASNGAYYRSYLSDWVAASELGGYGEIYATPRLVTEMKKEGKVATGNLYDPRLYATLVFEDPYFTDAVAKRVYGYTYDEVFGDGSAIAAFRKWVPSDIDLLGGAVAINIPLMRYADVVLMYAEVLNEQTKYGDAKDQINFLRSKRGMPDVNVTNKEQVFDQIVHERVMEFTLESSRFYDLRRWGLLQQNMQTAGRNFSMDKAYYPLPLKETINNPLAN